MRPVICTISALFFCMSVSLAQKEQPISNQQSFQQLTPMSSDDSLKLSQLPALKLPEGATKRLIPMSVDNSQLQFFRPLFTQSGLECGQAASIGLVFTYEMCFKKNVPANVQPNQYATYFTYNFINNGSDAGVNFYETYEILKHAGNPTVYDYGGLSYGGPTRWMSGYNLYYNAMHNRVEEVYSINVKSPEGIQTLKNWLFDHGDGSSAGGISCFYAQYTNPSAVLPDNTPEAGKAVITSWGASANHSMTIVGYNDSIRWDYNQDGLYTNNIDINFDGLIDVRDWEIGGLKIANTYGSVYNWGDEGFSYITYKSVADNYGQGGIWNNTVVVIDVNETYQPKLTAKVNLTYNCRNNLKVMAGVSTNPDATEPDYILHFPIFEYQGNCYNMQGNGGPDNIEFGLDLNPLLQYVDSAQQAKYFLLIREDDPFSANEGVLNSFDIINYTSAGAQVSNGPVNMTLAGNTVTYASVVASVEFDKVEILTDSIPPVNLYSTYTQQLTASGGTPPYRWRLVEKYNRFDSTAVMTVIDAVKLQPSSGSSGIIKVDLPFSFPFYGKTFDAVYATTGGYLLMENMNIPWPFYIEGRTYFLQNAMIAPFTSKPFQIANSSEGIWFEATSEYVTFRWKLSVYGASGALVNATARLFKDGTIEFNYGDCIIPDYIERFSGISAGNGNSYEILTYYPNFSPATNAFYRYSPSEKHEGITLDENGVLSVLLNTPVYGNIVTVCATDNNNIQKTTALQIHTTGLQLEYEVMAGDDNVICYGEDVSITLLITNHSGLAMDNVSLSLSTLTPFYTIIDGQAAMIRIEPGEQVTIPGAFLLKAHNDLPDGFSAPFQIQATSSDGAEQWKRTVYLTGYSANIDIANVSTSDNNNGIPEPGETVTVGLDVWNKGGADLTNAAAFLSSLSTYATVLSGTYALDTLGAQQTWHLTFEVSIAPETPVYEVVQLDLAITGNLGFNKHMVIPVLIGDLKDDFETGDFSRFDWNTSGNANWLVDDGGAYEGYSCAKSGLITHSQKSVLTLPWVTAYPDSITFWYKISSESNYDFLSFHINGQQMQRWSGDMPWKKASFSVAPGVSNFEWKYAKDYSVDANEDCARIDLVLLPMFSVPISAQNIERSIARFNVYPVPASKQCTISFAVEQNSHIEIYIVDVNGLVLYQNKQTATTGNLYSFKPQLDNYKPGVYSCILKSGSEVLVRKMIIF